MFIANYLITCEYDITRQIYNGNIIYQKIGIPFFMWLLANNINIYILSVQYFVWIKFAQSNEIPGNLSFYFYYSSFV